MSWNYFEQNANRNFEGYNNLAKHFPKEAFLSALKSLGLAFSALLYM